MGVCVDGACTLGICAERNAVFNMLTNDEDAIRRVVAVNWDGKVMPPCGACRELMAQLMPEGYKNMEVMLDYEKNEIVTLEALTPHWWIWPIVVFVPWTGLQICTKKDPSATCAKDLLPEK